MEKTEGRGTTPAYNTVQPTFEAVEWMGWQRDVEAMKTTSAVGLAVCVFDVEARRVIGLDLGITIPDLG